ncbi:MAG: hypothetical protein FWF13_03685, partial [Acidobacteria bacterium]|nr:hypothetical protein [Acidobacteriota bacterium]
MKEEFDRRQFLQTSARGIALAGIAGAAGRFTSVFAQTSKNGPPSEWIVEAIKEYTATSPRNS